MTRGSGDRRQTGKGYVFPYDASTLEELDAAADAAGGEPQR
jgi:hypothetical protein